MANFIMPQFAEATGGLCHAEAERSSPILRLRRSDGGGGEIRTPGELPHTRFPSVRTRPLCDPSELLFFV